MYWFFLLKFIVMAVKVNHFLFDVGGFFSTTTNQPLSIPSTPSMSTKQHPQTKKNTLILVKMYILFLLFHPHSTLISFFDNLLLLFFLCRSFWSILLVWSVLSIVVTYTLTLTLILVLILID